MLPEYLVARQEVIPNAKRENNQGAEEKHEETAKPALCVMLGFLVHAPGAQEGGLNDPLAVVGDAFVLSVQIAEPPIALSRKLERLSLPTEGDEGVMALHVVEILRQCTPLIAEQSG